ncbi:hypothetical protein CKJ81_04480 [Corynebacterium hadale]|uniref:Uncharacterized protein n=2 Tax=Corynebacterium hadale TaxID=2026255 RepID=A0ABX4HA58_9CORY|nr:hypothetical protein CKJ81_04480 [Corynebacterium hadale]
MRILKSKDTINSLSRTRTRSWLACPDDGGAISVDMKEHLTSKLVEYELIDLTTNTEIAPRTERAKELIAACLKNDEGGDELRILRRYVNVTHELEALADI